MTFPSFTSGETMRGPRPPMAKFVSSCPERAPVSARARVKVVSKRFILMFLRCFALAGRENILNAYHEAIKEKYRFFSFGDAMFIK